MKSVGALEQDALLAARAAAREDDRDSFAYCRRNQADGNVSEPERACQRSGDV